MIAEKFSAAAQEQIFFRQQKSVRDLAHHRKPRLRLLAPVFRVQNAIRLRRAASHASAKLVELRESEAIRAVYEHDRRIRHIHADLNHARRRQKRNLPARKTLHHLLLFLILHPAVHQPAPFLRKPAAQFFIHLRRRRQILLFALLDERADHVDLMPRVHFLSEETQHALPHIRPHRVRFHRMTPRRHAANRRYIQIAVHRERHRPRNRRRRHDESVRRRPLRFQCFPLPHPETMLLVRNHQPQMREDHGIFNQSVRPNQKRQLARRQILQNLRPLRPLRRARQNAHANRHIFIKFAKRLVMLPRQDLRRHHERGLETIFRHLCNRQRRHRRLPAADVPLDEPLHWRKPLHVVLDIAKRPRLIRRQRERKRASHPLHQLAGRAAFDSVLPRFPFLSEQKYPRLHEKQFFKRDTPTRRLPLPPILREMHPLIRLAPPHEAILHQNARRQIFRQILDARERRFHRFLHPRKREPLRQRINGHQLAEIR